MAVSFSSSPPFPPPPLSSSVSSFPGNKTLPNASRQDIAVIDAAIPTSDPLTSIVKLADLSKTFSFSGYLIGDNKFSNFTITVNGALIEPIHIIALGLNEECRYRERGCYYHLPPRKEFRSGHPCDLIFIDEGWARFDLDTWDDMNWEERLELCATKNKIKGEDRVIPICARIFSYGSEGESGGTAQRQQISARQNEIGESDAGTTTLSTRTALFSNQTFSSATTLQTHVSDPAARTGMLQYSRPIEDISTYLIHYEYLGAPALVCMTGAAEEDSICKRFSTPNDVSETYTRDPHPIDIIKICNDLETPEKRQVALRAASLVLSGYAYTTHEVVRRLLTVCNASKEDMLADEFKFGVTKRYWCELEDRIRIDRLSRDLELIKYWP